MTDAAPQPMWEEPPVQPRASTLESIARLRPLLERPNTSACFGKFSSEDEAADCAKRLRNARGDLTRTAGGMIRVRIVELGGIVLASGADGTEYGVYAKYLPKPTENGASA